MTNKRIVATYHHGFAGGSKNTSRILHLLAARDYDIEGFFHQIPHFFTYTKSKVKCNLFNLKIQSDVVDVANNYSATETIIRFLNKHSSMLFGANLFPYCDSLVQAKTQLDIKGTCASNLIIHPVGSDIWQIGPQIPRRVKWLIENSIVNKVVTYSQHFVDEIKGYYNIQRDIQVIPPVLEEHLFFPITDQEKNERKKRLGIPSDFFVIHHHSSLRRVKCPAIVIDIAIKFSELIKRPIVLCMVGPIPFDTIKQMGLSLERTTDCDSILYKTHKDNITIFWTGLVTPTQFLLQIADVELNASLHDSFNISLMEAMGCGVPCVSSDCVGIKEHVIRAEGGYFFPSSQLNFYGLNEVIKNERKIERCFDIDYAISALKIYASDSVILKEAGIRCAEYAKKEFNHAKIVDEYDSLFNQIT